MDKKPVESNIAYTRDYKSFIYLIIYCYCKTNKISCQNYIALKYMNNLFDYNFYEEKLLALY